MSKNDKYAGLDWVNHTATSEIERLRELVDASKEDRKAIDELVDENLRLRGLLKRSLYHLIVGCRNDDLIDEIKKEVGDD